MTKTTATRHRRCQSRWRRRSKSLTLLSSNSSNSNLPPCTGSFTKQYRLPCSHKILELMKGQQPLTKEHIHPRWWLRQPLNIPNTLLNIKDPEIVKTLRCRTRNKPIAYREENQPPSSSAPQPKAKAPRKSKNPAPRPVKQSIRRNRSEFEEDEDKLALPAASQQSTQDTIMVASGPPPPAAKKRRGGRRDSAPFSSAPVYFWF
ncbi:predicted protein [Chaetomium globosum CBS 148.51]|uniref:SWIM-type domain-containing protein n=1 Tax=Chaetomium globosum (strain ATCC 6205 / CBS 148.51 / DSM 1962 / NBRC 6347 / NRRL 1970) TaxID=306901 RepID=Q2HHH9_CHAGB|nr:uncharacterized protein CHGG_00325 [Chaetomium globosum CBS 148.51]EAQ92090.1 predicted protein [Chaetomium globosum CBS 148.51]